MTGHASMCAAMIIETFPIKILPVKKGKKKKGPKGPRSASAPTTLPFHKFRLEKIRESHSIISAGRPSDRIGRIATGSPEKEISV